MHSAFRNYQAFNFRGNLGNKMFTYALLYLFKLKYGYDVYVTKVVHDHLYYVFENLGYVKRIPSIPIMYIINIKVMFCMNEES